MKGRDTKQLPELSSHEVLPLIERLTAHQFPTSPTPTIDAVAEATGRPREEIISHLAALRSDTIARSYEQRLKALERGLAQANHKVSQLQGGAAALPPITPPPVIGRQWEPGIIDQTLIDEDPIKFEWSGAFAWRATKFVFWITVVSAFVINLDLALFAMRP